MLQRLAQGSASLCTIARPVTLQRQRTLGYGISSLVCRKAGEERLTPAVYTTASRCVAKAAASSMSSTPVKDSIRHKLTTTLNPTRLDILDESSKHAGHAAMKGLNAAETHFQVIVVSEDFEGLPSIKRHKLVFQALKDELDGPVHALSLKTRTPQEDNS